MNELIVVVALICALLSTAYAAYYQPTAAAHRALYRMLQQGEIRPEEFASHVNALERGR